MSGARREEGDRKIASTCRDRREESDGEIASAGRDRREGGGRKTAPTCRCSGDFPIAEGAKRRSLDWDDIHYFDPRGALAQTRNRLPHWEQEEVPHFLTFRLGDALPAQLLHDWTKEREIWMDRHPRPWTDEVDRLYHRLFPRRIEQWLDAGYGACSLKAPACAQIVAEALAYFEGERSRQIAWVIMPNHVHSVVAPCPGERISRLVHAWKRNSAVRINRILGRFGVLWERDYFSRLVRDQDHLIACVRYIRRNPKKANLRRGEYLAWESDLARGVEG